MGGGGRPWNWEYLAAVSKSKLSVCLVKNSKQLQIKSKNANFTQKGVDRKLHWPTQQWFSKQEKYADGKTVGGLPLFMSRYNVS